MWGDSTDFRTCRQSPTGVQCCPGSKDPPGTRGAECMPTGTGEALTHHLSPPHPTHQGSSAMPSYAISHCTTPGPGRSVDLSWTHTGATILHHPCSVQNANRASAYRQIVTHLPSLIFLKKDTECGPMEGQRGKPWLVWDMQVSRSRAGPDPLALAFRESQTVCECLCGLWHQGSASVCLWVPLFVLC